MGIKDLEMKEEEWKLIPLFMQFEDVNNILQSHLELSIQMYRNEYDCIKKDEEKYDIEIQRIKIEKPELLNDFEPNDEEFYLRYTNLEKFYSEQKKLLVNYFTEYFENIWVLTKNTLVKLEMYSSKLKNDYEYIWNKSDFNEVRLINNCIKHCNFKVSDELHKSYPKYITGDEIVLDEELLWNLKDKSVAACNELNKKLKAYLQALRK